MSFSQRTLQHFFLFLGIAFVAMFILRGLAPDSRKVLWQLLCPPTTSISVTTGEAELKPGEIVSAYEVVCVGDSIRQPLEDVHLILLEFGVSIGLAVIMSVIFGWIASRKKHAKIT